MANLRSRNYCFTVNNYTNDDEHQCWALPWEAKECVYIVVGKEVGETGTPHLQGFVCFSTLKSMKQLKDFFPTAHFEIKRGTFLQASDYCKKDADFFEWGVLPNDPVEKGLKGAAAFEAMMTDTVTCIREGRYTDIPMGATHHIKAAEYRVLKETQQNRAIVNIAGPMEHEWYYGEAGSGKSLKARTDNPDAYLKMCNKWWDGYANEEVVIIEDFDKDHKVLVHHLKIWADRYVFPAEIKGAKIDIRPRKIIVTSNYHPSDIWENAKDLEPILRRFKLKVFHLHTFNNPFALVRAEELDVADNESDEDI